MYLSERRADGQAVFTDNTSEIISIGSDSLTAGKRRRTKLICC